MVEVEKKKVTLSLPVESNDKLEKMAQKYGMTKSGLVTFLINQADDKTTIFKKKSPARKIARARKIWFSLISQLKFIKFSLVFLVE